MKKGAELPKMKTGDRFEAPSGLGFVITSMDRKSITVRVERTFTKDGVTSVVKNVRVVPREDFAVFARAYEPVKK